MSDCGFIKPNVSICQPMDTTLVIYEDNCISRDYGGISTREHWQVMECDCHGYGSNNDGSLEYTMDVVRIMDIHMSDGHG